MHIRRVEDGSCARLLWRLCRVVTSGQSRRLWEQKRLFCIINHARNNEKKRIKKTKPLERETRDKSLFQSNCNKYPIGNWQDVIILR